MLATVTITKIPSASTNVPTKTPRISSPHGNRSRAIAVNANVGVKASLNKRMYNRLSAI